ncbi:hypothetical protein QQZ08_004550 [Neonectria magnoliae]|uniref:BRCT domain-containing protein n=1 Tax=Neonectria magnoliae TaxID=2732573 RepID=A0ABR1I5T7_9HYPO
MPRQIFKNRVLAAAGTLPGQLTVENLSRWSQLRKGRFTEDFDDDVTHLLCTREQFNKRVPRVKEALKRGNCLHIVHYDWFEFSTVQEKRQSEREYSMRNILAKQNALRREQARIEKGKKDGEKFVNTNFFHIYIDREFFPYQIDLTRDDESTGEFGQRYTLCLWESDAKPHLYWFTAKFLKKRGNSQPSYYRPSPCSGKWRAEMDLFMEFFRIKTGIDWEDRVVKMNTMASSFFQYAPPTGGKPVGRRLRFNYDYCRQVNAELRGLPWPPIEEDASPNSDSLGDGPLASIYDEENDISPDQEMEGCEPALEADDENQTNIDVHEEEPSSTSQGTSATSSENSSTRMSSFSVTQASSSDKSCPSPKNAERSNRSQNPGEIIPNIEHSQQSASCDIHQ